MTEFDELTNHYVVYDWDHVYLIWLDHVAGWQVLKYGVLGPLTV